MANRYWVGSSQTWDPLNTGSPWSATSGGSPGASVPTTADDVFFDQAVTDTVTLSGALNCRDITVSAGTITFATGTSPTLNIAGSMNLKAGTVWSATGTITFSATTTGKTVTTNGTTLSGAVTFNGAGGGWTLGSPLTSVGIVTVTTGTFDTSSTGNHAVSCTQFQISGASTRTINLNASTITCSIAATNAFSATTLTGLTFNAGTSQITLTGSTAGIASGGLTFYNASFTSTTAGTRAIIGVNTFNNFAVTAPSIAGVTTVTFDSKQTINGTLSTTGTAGNRRVFFASATYGISVDLAVNSAPSLTDADFRGIYVTGTAAPISGTRIGNRGECRNITFDTPKTVYWNLAGAQNWSANGWATTSTGVPSTNNFPLPQDTATFTNAGSVTGTITLDTALAYVPNVDMSGRTTAMTLGTSNATTVYGNWTNGSGTAFTGTAALTFSGGGTQTITSAGKTFTGNITIDTYGGTVQLADPFNIGTNTLTVTNGTFSTQNNTVSAGLLSSSNTNVRTINLGSSTITLTGTTNVVTFTTSTNLTFNAGTSTINAGPDSGGNWKVIDGGTGVTFYNVVVRGATSSVSSEIRGTNTFSNLTLISRGLVTSYTFYANQTITGTLTSVGLSAVLRNFLRSDTIGTQRTLTVNSISATDCDFRDINLAGAASGSSPTRAGDCGGNAGITFPAPKTVYWNLAGAQNWSATGWATSSGGAPAVNNFPLAQDTAVFDNTGAAGTVTFDGVWNIGTLDASGRTSAMTLATSAGTPFIYGDWKFGTGVTSSSSATAIFFQKSGTQTITSNGVQFGCPITIANPLTTVQLADALSLNSARTLTLTTGTFDAVTYNVTVGAFTNSATTNTLKMGSGTWTLSGTVTVWNTATLPTMFAGTSTIVLSDTTTAARTFAGGAGYFNKLTIGGATGISTLTINGNNTFGELASTKTVAHGVRFVFNTTQTIGKWSITGTVGNVVTVDTTSAGTTFSLTIAGPANTGIDYLSVRDCAVSTTSPGEFYVGVNSTNVSGNTGTIIFTATPAARTLYWRGGTGNWSATTSWATTSGGAGPAPIPTSLDAVNFNSASNATAYTATIDAGVTIARCASFTMAGPTAGNVTFAGTVPIAFHGNVSFAATGITRTYTGAMNWAGNSSYTFTTNGLALASAVTINGIGSTWTLGFNTNIGSSTLTVTYGTFSTSGSNYSLTAGALSSNNSNVRTVSLNGSALALSASIPLTFATSTNLTFSAGTSTITTDASAPAFNGGGQTFYNVSFNQPTGSNATITGANTFNNLTFTGRTTVGISASTFSANQTINGTLTVSAGTASAYRTFLASDTIGTTRTLTCAAVSLTDADFRDITIAGAAAPAGGTRLGDAKGNSGITFPGAKTVYWAVNSANWGATGNGSWTDVSGNPAVATQFPLAQDTASIPFATPTSGSTITVNANYNIGTLDMSNRNGSALVTLATGTTSPTIYGNWINGTGTTVSGTGRLTYAGRGAQTIRSEGKTFTQQTTINSLGGSVTLQDAWVTNSGSTNLNPELLAGTFDANGYSVANAGTATFLAFSSTGNLNRTLVIGSGTWTFAGGGSQWNVSGSNFAVTGSGTISLTSASSKNFSGGGISYSGITLDQGGAGTLTINGNNTFKTITNTYSATGATSIALGSTTQTLTTPWTATGAAGNILTISGTSAASPGTLVYTGAGTGANVNYLSISNVRAYDVFNEWYAGNNSTNGGSLGWYFTTAGGTVYAATITETGTGTDSVIGGLRYLGTISELATSSDAFAAAASFRGVISETGTGTDTISAKSAFGTAILESATIADTDLARLIARATLSETATGADIDVAGLSFPTTISETATATQTDVGYIRFPTTIAETATGTETVTPRYIARPNIVETATGTDTVSARAVFLAAIAESGTITDLIDCLKGYIVHIVESATGADTVSPQYIAKPVITETASGTETVASQYIAKPTVAETATGTDTVSPQRTTRPTIAETATGTDAVTPRYITNPSISESATGTEVVTTRATVNSDIAERSSVIEIVQAYFVAAARVTETATGTDQVSALRALAAAVAETATITDSLSARAVFVGLLQEAATAQDAVNAPGSTYNILMQELASAQDAITTQAIFPASLAETATGTEINSAAFIPRATITESATITDAASAVQRFAARILETSAASDVVLVAPSIFNAIAVASATALDSLNAPGSIYHVTVPESATLSDSVLGAYLWNIINDSQSVNWQNVLDAQSVTWNAVNVSQTAGWTNVDNAQSTSWGTIRDDQDPDWKDIPTL